VRRGLRVASPDPTRQTTLVLASRPRLGVVLRRAVASPALPGGVLAFHAAFLRRRARAALRLSSAKYWRLAASGSGASAKRARNAARPGAVRAARSSVFAQDLYPPIRPRSCCSVDDTGDLWSRSVPWERHFCRNVGLAFFEVASDHHYTDGHREKRAPLWWALSSFLARSRPMERTSFRAASRRRQRTPRNRPQSDPPAFPCRCRASRPVRRLSDAVEQAAGGYQLSATEACLVDERPEPAVVTASARESTCRRPLRRGPSSPTCS